MQQRNSVANLAGVVAQGAKAAEAPACKLAAGQMDSCACYFQVVQYQDTM